MWINKHFVWLFIYLLSPFILNGETLQLTFDRLSKKNGLSHNRVTKIYKDSQGFMWFGTLQGLNRYDGLRISNFESELSKGDDPISNQQILTIFEDQDSTLTITNLIGEAAFYDQLSGKLLRARDRLPKSLINPSVFARSKSQDADGNSWYAYYGGGVVKVEAKTKKITNFYYQPDEPQKSLSSNMVYDILADGDYIWIGTDNGLDRFNHKTLKIERFRNNKKDKNSIPNNIVFAIYKDTKGMLWLGTSNGVSLFNPNENSFKNYFNQVKNTNSICDNRITSIAEDVDGRIWIGTQKGLACITDADSKKEVISNYYNDNGDPNSLSSNYITTIFIDNKNTIWIGTYDKGINIASLKEKPFKHYNQNEKYPYKISQDVVRALYEDSDSIIWVGGTNREINIINRKAGTTESVNILNTSEPDRNCQIKAFSQDSQGNMWIGTSSYGLKKILHNELYSKNRKIVSYSKNSSNSSSLISNDIQDIFTDRDGRLWIGTEGGLSLYDSIEDNFITIGNDPTAPNQLSDNRIQSNAIYQDSKGSIWIGTWKGLNKLLENRTNQSMVIDGITVPANTIRFKNYLHNQSNSNSLSDNRITCIIEDYRKNLYISTYGNGVNIYEEITDNFKHLNEVDGLSNNFIYTVVEDDSNDIWFSTNYGLSKYVFERNHFRNYDEKDGIQGNYFYWGSGIKCKDGSLAFGGTNGINIFNPLKLSDDTSVPPVNFSDLQINNKSILPGTDDSILKTPIWITKEITLPYSKDFIKLDFAALNYIHPEKNRYNYKLEGFDNEWVTVTNKSSVTYTNLEPKRYIFKVRASNNDGVWENEYTELIINITPPYYSTVWFKVLVAILLIGFVLLLIFLKIQSNKKERTKLEQMIAMRTAELSDINFDLNHTYNDLRETNVLLQECYEENSQQKEAIFDQHDDILLKNRELEYHRNNLENIVLERTKELVKAKNRAEEAERLKSAFIANMSHEIRTPLNAIVGFSNLITIDDNTQQEKKEYSHQIASNTVQLLTLVEDILELSTIEAKQLHLDIETVNLQLFLEKIYKFWHSRFSTHTRPIILKNNIESREYEITTDVVKVRKILERYLSNACKYCTEGAIEIGTYRNSTELVFYVKDSGIGIPEEIQPDIFQAYKNKGIGKNFKFRGSGLGLAIALKMAEVLNAKVWLESVEGEGATFYLSIPQNFS